MFFDWFLKSFRILLLPFALLYGFIVVVRNWLYDKNWLRSASFGLPLICVGNLSVGGTGKSPMVELLVAHLKQHFKVATLSRGYKRKTSGYALATPATTAIDIGDEPMQFHRKFPEVPVAVGEERIVAIPQLLHDCPDTEVIILDDAFQHRAIRAGLNIILTDYGNLFTRDFFIPTGDLRDGRSAAKRAEIIVVTKCPPALSREEAAAIKEEIAPGMGQQLFFTTIAYGQPYHILGKEPTHFTKETEVLLVTGIANPRPLKTFLEDQVHTYHLMQFGDHHIFTIDDFRDIKKRFDALQGATKMVLTTEKDAMRLEKFAQEINGMPFSVLPIEHRFLFGGTDAFMETVVTFIVNFKKPA